MERFSDRVKRLVELIKTFNYQQAFNEFYDEDLTRVQNVGKWTLDAATYRDRIDAFMAKSSNRNIEIKNVIVNESMQMTIIEYSYSLDHAEKGRIELGNVTIQKWQNGRIVFEKLYDTGLYVTQHSEAGANARKAETEAIALTGNNAFAA